MRRAGFIRPGCLGLHVPKRLNARGAPRTLGQLARPYEHAPRFGRAETLGRLDRRAQGQEQRQLVSFAFPAVRQRLDDPQSAREVVHGVRVG